MTIVDKLSEFDPPVAVGKFDGPIGVTVIGAGVQISDGKPGEIIIGRPDGTVMRFVDEGVARTLREAFMRRN